MGESIEARVWHLEKIVASLLTLKGISLRAVNLCIVACLRAYALLLKRAAIVSSGRSPNSCLQKILKNEISIDREIRYTLAVSGRI